jgi:hypothetical protein
LQDCRTYYCHHIGSANLLVADGSVHEYGDANGDKLLNPGFQITNAVLTSVSDNSASELASQIGYTDSQEDLPRTEIFSGMFIKNIAQTKLRRTLQN